MAAAPPIVTDRLTLVVMDAAILAAIVDGHEVAGGFTWPEWWPDEVDRHHVARWRARAHRLNGRDSWRPRAIVERGSSEMVGHVGFHLLPTSLEEAIAGDLFEGTIEPAANGAVEIGYTIFPAQRRRGYATEAVAAMVEWAFATGEISTVLAGVAEDNTASAAVVNRVGGFRRIGIWRNEDGSVESVLRRDAVTR